MEQMKNPNENDHDREMVIAHCNAQKEPFQKFFGLIERTFLRVFFHWNGKKITSN